MQSTKLNFLVTVLTLGLKVKIFRNLRLFIKRKFWWELRTRPTLDRSVAITFKRQDRKILWDVTNGQIKRLRLDI